MNSTGLSSQLDKLSSQKRHRSCLFTAAYFCCAQPSIILQGMAKTSPSSDFALHTFCSTCVHRLSSTWGKIIASRLLSPIRCAVLLYPVDHGRHGSILHLQPLKFASPRSPRSTKPTFLLRTRVPHISHPLRETLSVTATHSSPPHSVSYDTENCSVCFKFIHSIENDSISFKFMH